MPELGSYGQDGRCFQLSRVPLEFWSWAPEQGSDFRVHHGRAPVRAEAGEENSDTRCAREQPPRVRHGPEVFGVCLVVAEHEAAKAVADQPLHDLDNDLTEGRSGKRDGSREATGERTCPIG